MFMPIVWMFAAATAAAAAAPSPGHLDKQGRYFLFREPVEMYWNDWTGMPLNRGTAGQIDVHILGEGKSQEFDGVVSLNCTTGSGFFWKEASVWGKSASESDIAGAVPLVVISNARNLFCPTDAH